MTSLDLENEWKNGPRMGGVSWDTWVITELMKARAKLPTIKGRVTHIGDLTVDDDMMTGVFIECTRDELKNSKSNILGTDVDVYCYGKEGCE